MTTDTPGRSPLFGRPASTPYAGGTGSTGSAASHARREYEDEHGVSAYRQQQVLGHLREAGTVGLTWSELGERMGWHHGQTTGALSVLHRDGVIAALTARRKRSTVYVAPEFVADRRTRPPGQTRGNQALAEANEALHRENGALSQRILDLQAALGERDAAAAEREGDLTRVEALVGELSGKVRTAEQQLALAVEQMARLDDERGRFERGVTLAKQDAEEALARVRRLERENEALRVRRALIELDEEERALHDRIGARLAEPEVEKAADSVAIKVTLGAIRSMWMTIGRLVPDALPTRERPRSRPAAAESAEEPATPDQAADPEQ